MCQVDAESGAGKNFKKFIEFLRSGIEIDVFEKQENCDALEKQRNV